MAEHVLSCVPRVLPMPGMEGPAVLFTDGSYEPAAGDKPTLAACGGALMLQGRAVAHFSATIPPALLARWLEGRLQPISQIEMIPLLLARRLWRRELREEGHLLR